MTQPSPFDHRPDPVLGSVLRDVLTADGESHFVRRVVEAVEGGGEAAPWWSVLTGWARPSLVAALFIVTLAGFALGALLARSQAPGGVALGDPLHSDSDQLAAPVLLTGNAAPSVDEFLAVAMGR